MKQTVRRAQLFLHEHYENIKLVLLLTIMALVGYMVMTILVNNTEASRERAEGIVNIVKSIERETDEQTKTINRQLQALCFLLVTTSGEQVLKELDPPLEEQCRNLAHELKQEEQAAARSAPRVAEPSPDPPTNQPVQQPASSALQPSETPQTGAERPEPTDPTPQPSTPTERPQSVLERVLQPIDGLIRNLIGGDR